MDQRLTEADALAVAVRELADIFAEHGTEAADLDDVAHALFERARVNSTNIGDKA